MTLLLRRKRPTIARGPITPARMPASLAVLALLLSGSLAAAQTPGPSLPPLEPPVVPAIHTIEPSITQPSLQPATPAAAGIELLASSQTGCEPRASASMAVEACNV